MGRYSVPKHNKGKGKTFAWIVEHSTYAGDDCIKWPFCTLPQGRGILGHNGKRYHAARLMCEIVHGKPPTPAYEAAHECGNGHKGCMNPRHISWKTRSENRRDSVKHGTNVRFAGRRLDYEKATEIRALQGRLSAFKVAEQYGVHPNTIYFVWQGRTFKSRSTVLAKDR